MEKQKQHYQTIIRTIKFSQSPSPPKKPQQRDSPEPIELAPVPTEADIFARAEEMAKELAEKMCLEKLTVLERQLDSSRLNES